MAGNFFDQFDTPAAPPSSSGNFFDQFEEAPPQENLDWTSNPDLTRDQLLEAYRKLPKDDPRREQVKRRVMEAIKVPTMSRLQSGIAGATDSMSLGLSDEINAGLSAITGGDYSRELANQRNMMKNAEADNPGTFAGGQMAGALVSAIPGGGLGAARAAVRAPQYASAATKALRVAGAGSRAAAEGAATGAVYGFNTGEGGLKERLSKAGADATAAAIATPIAKVAARGIGSGINRLKGQTGIWSADEIERTSKTLYNQANQAGAVVRPNTTTNLGRRMIAQVVNDENYDPATPEAFVKARQAMGAVERSFVNQGAVRLPGGGAKMNAPKTLSEMETLRRRLTELAGDAATNDEKRLIYKMRATLDEGIDQLQPADMVNGSPDAFRILEQARGLWRVKADTEWAEDAVRRAEARAGQFSVSKMENALRTEARGVSLNDKKLGKFDEPTQRAIEKVANPGAVQNTIRNLSKFSPTSGTAPYILAGVNPALGSTMMGLGMGAQVASGELTKRNFRQLQRTIQRGLPEKDIPVPRGERLVKRAAKFATPGLLDSEAEVFFEDAKGNKYDREGRLIE
jgi:hypothetical protein